MRIHYFTFRYVVPLGFNDQGQKVLLLNFGMFNEFYRIILIRW